MGIKVMESREQQRTLRDASKQKGILVPRYFDPHVMAIGMNRRSWNKRAQSTSYLIDEDRKGEHEKIEERAPRSFNQLIMAMDGG